MRSKQIVYLAACLTLVLAVSAAAQPGQGSSEVSFGAAYYDFTEGDFEGSLQVTARYGYFLTDALELGGGLFAAGTLEDIDAILSAEVFGVYHFSPGETNTWYVKGSYFTLIEEPGDGFLDLAGGIKAYISPDAAFFWEVSYGTGISDDLDTGIIRSLAGLSFTF